MSSNESIIMETKKIELVLIPLPGISHIVSMVNMAKMMVARDQRLFITVFHIKRPGFTAIPDAANTLQSLFLGDQKRIRFLHLREPDSTSIMHLNYSQRFFATTGELQIPIVREAVTAEVLGRPGSGKLAGILIDMFCAAMVDVAKEFQVPSYIYFPTSASLFGLMYHMKALRDERGTDGSEFMNSDALLDIPIFSHPYPAKVLPLLTIDETLGSTTFLDLTKKYNQAEGIVVNTFAELESRAVKIISENEKFPPIYPVGPILNLEKTVGEDYDEIIRWLDGQPPSSVVYLCFGSMGTLEESQVKEIAVALERSGHRFLWSLRMLEVVLPEGFLERTLEVGKVVGWTPQVEVLSHDAVGGFVSHCGWNSTLESLWCGVPIATWPLFAEQQMDAFLLVKELELAVEVKMDYRQNFSNEIKDEIVGASVIESAIRRLMDDDDDHIHGRNEMRKKVKNMSQMSRNAVMEGGSSYISLGRFIVDLIHNAPCDVINCNS